MATMIFPSCVPGASKLLATATDLPVIGASSLESEPSADRFSSWLRLPRIEEPAFFESLRSAVSDHGITSIATSHAPTFLFLSRELGKNIPGVRLVGESPYAAQASHIRELIGWAEENEPFVHRFSGRHIDPLFLASLKLHAGSIYGECSDDKILGLCAALCRAPKGDVVEIGAFFGKSAFVLNRLARHFDIGRTLIIDPWDEAQSVQKDSLRHIRDLSKVWDWDLVHSAFLLNLYAACAEPFQHLRMTSEQAARQYTGEISVLHIDGNHDEAQVRRDYELWSPKVVKDGWIIFDDYDWPGPRAVADSVEWESCFEIDGARFLMI